MKEPLTVTKLMEWLAEQPRQAEIKIIYGSNHLIPLLEFSGISPYNILKIEVDSASNYT